MRRPFAFLAAALAFAGSVSGARASDVRVNLVGAYAADFVQDEMRRDPIEADQRGVYAYGDQLPDLSAAGHAANLLALRTWRAKFAALQSPALALADAADLRAVLDRIDRELLADELLAPWKNEPRGYVGAIGAAVYLPLVRENETVPLRFGHIAARLPNIAALAAAAQANLDRPTRVATDTAAAQLRGTMAIYRNLPENARTAGAPAATQAAIAAALPAALASLEKLQAFLDGPLAARSDRDPRIGAAAYDRLFAVTVGTDVTPAELATRARERIAATRARMLAIAEPLYTGPAVAGDGDARTTAIVRSVLDSFAQKHATRAGFLDAIRADVASVTAFLERSHFVELPQPATLRVRETPAFAQGLAGASMSSAGPFAPLEPSYYNVDPFPPTWDDARVGSWLREYNDAVTQILTIHEALPGHYVQLRYANANPSVVRRMFGNGSFIEGWACWTEAAMLDAGYGAGDPALRLSQLKWRLREATNALIDIEYHRGSLTEDEAMRMMVDGALQERAEAQGKWNRLRLSHVQLTTYFAGLDAIERAQAAANLDDRETARRLLAMGSVEPRFIAPLLRAAP